MTMLPRKASAPPPPAPPARRVVLCAECGVEVPPLEQEGLLSLRHYVCDPARRADVNRRVEAMRSLHRARIALGTWPPAKEQLERELAALPDAVCVGDVLDVLARVRVATECAVSLTTEQRQVALSYVDRMAASLR